MQDQLSISAISLTSGALIAAQDLPGTELADRIGVAAIAVMVVWWMLGSFSKRLDRLTEAIATLTEQVRGSAMPQDAHAAVRESTRTKS